VLTQLHDRVRFPGDLPGMLGTGVWVLTATLVASVAITAVGRRIPGVRRAF
jgi:hypothetical protein